RSRGAGFPPDGKASPLPSSRPGHSLHLPDPPCPQRETRRASGSQSKLCACPWILDLQASQTYPQPRLSSEGRRGRPRTQPSFANEVIYWIESTKIPSAARSLPLVEHHLVTDILVGCRQRLMACPSRAETKFRTGPSAT